MIEIGVPGGQARPWGGKQSLREATALSPALQSRPLGMDNYQKNYRVWVLMVMITIILFIVVLLRCSSFSLEIFKMRQKLACLRHIKQLSHSLFVGTQTEANKPQPLCIIYLGRMSLVSAHYLTLNLQGGWEIPSFQIICCGCLLAFYFLYLIGLVLMDASHSLLSEYLKIMPQNPPPLCYPQSWP